MRQLDNELSHYHGAFDHIDTINLGILLNLKLQEKDFVSVEFENGKCVVDGKDVLDLSNVSEFANNGLLKRLQQDLAEIEEKYVHMKSKYAKGEASDSERRDYEKIALRRGELIETIEYLQKQIFKMTLNLCKDDVRGTITIEQREAFRLLELGDYEGAVAFLQDKDKEAEYFRKSKIRVEQQKEESRSFIQNRKTAIDILMTKIKYDNRFKNIEYEYETIVPIAENNLVELDVIYDYANYLLVQNKQNRALTIAKKLELIYDNNPDIDDEHNKSALFCLLGHICNSISSKYKLAEKYYLKAIKIAEKSAEENPDKYLADLATYCDCAGLYYEDHINKEKTENYFNKAVDIFATLAKENPDKDYYGFAIIYDNVGSFLDEQENEVKAKEKAEDYHNKALNILEKLALENPKKYFADLALCYKSFGLFYKRNGNRKKAEYYLNQAIALRENLAKENPEKFNPCLAISYDNLAMLYKQNNRKKAEDLYLKALDIWKYMVELDPEKYIPDLSICYNNLGMFYSDVDLVKSTIYYIKAIETSEKIVLKNPERFNPHLAITYYNFSGFNNQYLEKAYQIAKNSTPDNIYCKQIIDYVESN